MGFERKDLHKAETLASTVIEHEALGQRINYSAWVKKDPVAPQILEDLLLAITNGDAVPFAAKNLGITIFDVSRMRLLDKEFNTAMNEALKLRLTLLEEKAWALAHDGESESQTQSGLGTYKRTKDSVAMVQFLLKAYHPEKYGVERKEVRAGPLDTPPEVVRGEGDRDRLIAQIESRRRLRAETSTEPAIDVAAKQIATLDDLLS
jgi:hypothetical protein